MSPEADRGWFGDQHADAISRRKRLADAELAAEVWFAVAREAHAEAMGRRSGAPDWVTTNHIESRIARTLERFASLPHYDEADK